MQRIHLSYALYRGRLKVVSHRPSNAGDVVILLVYLILGFAGILGTAIARDEVAKLKPLRSARPKSKPQTFF